MARLLTSTLSAKGQTTIPARVRKQLGIQPGDTIAYELDDGGVRIRKSTPLEVEWARAVESTLSEWADGGDDDL